MGTPDPVPQAGLGTAAPQTPAPAPQTPQQQLGLGSNAPNYDQLKNDAIQAYLSSGGTQANVDAYFAANPNPSYGKLASDATQWYTGPERNTPQPPDSIGFNSYNGPWDPSMPEYQQGQRALRDFANQQVSSYFGIPQLPAGQNFPTYSPSNQGNPARTPPPPATQTAPQQPQPVLAGQPAPPPVPSGQPSSGFVPGYGPVPTDPLSAGTNQGPYAPGSGTMWDPWIADLTTPNVGTPLQPGYAYGAPTPGQSWTGSNGQTGMLPGRPGQLVKWDQPGGPASSLTMGGQTQMNQPLTAGGLTQSLQAGGQQFAGLQPFLNFMGQSTPAEQQIKAQLEQAGLFDKLAPYLGTQVNQPPGGATPFTNWDPVGLLQLLLQSGILTGDGQPQPTPNIPFGPDVRQPTGLHRGR